MTNKKHLVEAPQQEKQDAVLDELIVGIEEIEEVIRVDFLRGRKHNDLE